MISETLYLAKKYNNKQNKGKQTMEMTEAVSDYHPDKIADHLADYLAEWWKSDVRSAIEVLVKDDLVVVGGEKTGGKKITEYFVKEALTSVYGDQLEYYCDPEKTRIIIQVGEQSLDIKKSRKEGAGDNGIVYGYRDVPREHKRLHGLLNDCINAGVTYGDCKAIYKACARRSKIVLNMHRDDALAHPIMMNDISIKINPSGKFETGGVWADAGVTGRKLMSDAYGCGHYHGGGATHGKDLTKVDRSGAYLARELALYLNRRLEDVTSVMLSYKIGQKTPEIFYQSSSNEGFSDLRYINRRVYHELVDHGISVKETALRYAQALNGLGITRLEGSHYTNRALPWNNTNYFSQ